MLQSRYPPSGREAVRKCVSLLEYTFRVLPQGQLRSQTVCRGIIARDLSLGPRLPSVKLFPYIDDVMLTSEEPQPLQQCLDILCAYLQDRGCAISPQEIRGRSTAVKFLGVSWSGKMHSGHCH